MAHVRLNNRLPIPDTYSLTWVSLLPSPEGPLLRPTPQPNALISVLLRAYTIPLSYFQTQATPRIPGPQSSIMVDTFRPHPSMLGERFRACSTGNRTSCESPNHDPETIPFI